MKVLVLLTGLLLLSTHVGAAPPSDVPAKHWAAGSVNRLKAQHILKGEADGQFRGDKPVTRYELAVTLDRLVRYLEAGRQPLTVQPAPHSVALPAGADPATQQALRHLVNAGFIPQKSPLLQGNKIVTAQELTTALSQITIRLSDRSLPPNKE